MYTSGKNEEAALIYTRAVMEIRVYKVLLNPTLVALFSMEMEETVVLTSVRRINGSGVFMLAKISEFMVFATVTDIYLPMRKCLRYRILRYRAF